MRVLIETHAISVDIDAREGLLATEPKELARSIVSALEAVGYKASVMHELSKLQANNR